MLKLALLRFIWGNEKQQIKNVWIAEVFFVNLIWRNDHIHKAFWFPEDEEERNTNIL